MLSMLLVWDKDGNVIATLDYAVRYDPVTREPMGLIDFEAHERTGGKMRDIYDVSALDAPVPDGEPKHLHPNHPFRLAHETVAGSGTWPEWIGTRAHDFRVELAQGKVKKGGTAIIALIHKTSGHRRERATIETQIGSRIAAKREEAKNGQPEPTDIRDLVGGPERPLPLGEDGRNLVGLPTEHAVELPLVSLK